MGNKGIIQSYTFENKTVFLQLEKIACRNTQSYCSGDKPSIHSFQDLSSLGIRKVKSGERGD